MESNKHLYPIIDPNRGQKNKERILNQMAKVIWITGLSGAGKTTIAIELEKHLTEKGFFIKILDADHVRAGINVDLGFSDCDRHENIRRVVEISKLFFNSGIICINSFISPTKEIRETAKKIIGKENFIEIYVNCPIEICEQRDKKDLYKKVRLGEIQNFTGFDSPFEAPINPDIELRTDELSVKESVDKCLRFILPYIKT